MTEQIVINTSPLIALGKMDAFDVIARLPFELSGRIVFPNCLTSVLQTRIIQTSEVKGSMSEEFKYDVFISHSSKDKPAVRELAERLRRDGLRIEKRFKYS